MMFICKIKKEIEQLKIQKEKIMECILILKKQNPDDKDVIQFEKSYNEINEELKDLEHLLMTIEYNLRKEI